MTVSVAITQLDVFAAHTQVTVSAANMWLTIFVVIMQMGVSIVIMQVSLTVMAVARLPVPATIILTFAVPVVFKIRNSKIYG